MISRRYETIVGIFVVASLVALLIMVLIIARQEGLFQQYVEYQAIFKNVSGLKVGSEVHLAGVTVGNVKEIIISPDGSTLVTFNVIKKYSDRVRAGFPGLHRLHGPAGGKEPGPYRRLHRPNLPFRRRAWWLPWSPWTSPSCWPRPAPAWRTCKKSSATWPTLPSRWWAKKVGLTKTIDATPGDYEQDQLRPRQPGLAGQRSEALPGDYRRPLPRPGRSLPTWRRAKGRWAP